jgi:LuxR family maltose regulon positive regulatory protein
VVELDPFGKGRPLVPAKLDRAPAPRTTLPRPRVVGLLAEATAAAPFALVVAGPGYGKTVAVNEWLDGEPGPVAWLSLDPTDDEPAQLWRYLAAAIEQAVPGAGREALMMLADEQDPQHAIPALLAELWNRSTSLDLVLNDLHVLRSHAVLDGVAAFIEQVPPTVRIVATSRVDPALPLGRWRAEGRLAEIRQRDLRFTDEEAAALVELHDGLEIEPADLVALTERTEGWAVGLQLALVSLRGRPDASGSILSSLVGDRAIADYLLGEILDSLAPADQELLLSLSVVDDFDPGLAVAVSGQADAAARLRSLEARNLFLLPADDRGESFRFHQLLRELLVEELRWRTPGRDVQLHLAAADHLESIGSHHDAVRHLVRAGEIDRAFQLIVEPAWELLDGGNVGATRAWLAVLPDGVLGTDVDRILGYVVLLTAAGRVDEADRWIARLEGDGAVEGFEFLQRLHFFGLRAMMEYIRGDLEPSKLSVLHCVELLGDGALHGPVLDRMGGLLVRHALDDHRCDIAEYWLTAMVDHQNESVVVRDLLPSALAARCHLQRGQLDDAERLSRHVVEVAGARGMSAIAPTGEARTVLAEVLLERGLLADAAEQSALALEELSERRLTVAEIRARLVAIAVATARFGPRSGLSMLQVGRLAYEDRYLGVDLRQSLDGAECRLLLLDGDLVEGGRLLHAMAPSDQRSLLEARVALLAGRRSEAESALDGRDWSAPADQVEALALRARAAAGPDAFSFVREAAELAVANGCRHVFLREGSEFLRLARRANHDQSTAALDELLASLAPARGTRVDAAFAEPLTARERALLQLLPTHLTYREMAAELCVSINTVKTYQKALFRKLHASTRSEAVAVAREAGLLATSGRPGRS